MPSSVCFQSNCSIARGFFPAYAFSAFVSRKKRSRLASLESRGIDAPKR